MSRWEGLRLAPYNDAGGNATIGYGHLLHRGPVLEADRERWSAFNAAGAVELLRRDLGVAEAAILRDVDPPLSMQTHFDALASLVFNIGTSAFAYSTLRRLLNAGQRGQAAAEQFLRWDRAGGRVIPGLAARRISESRLWLHGSYDG